MAATAAITPTYRVLGSPRVSPRHAPVIPISPAPSVPPEWSRSMTLVLAQQSCTLCYGLGLRIGAKVQPCGCVLRRVFRLCLGKAQSIREFQGVYTRMGLERTSGKSSRFTYGRKREEFLADFHLITKRTLSPFQFQLFDLHFVQGHEWRACCRRMGIDRGTFFHMVYRVEEVCGRAFRETKPYSLYLFDEYFQGGRMVQEASENNGSH